MATTYTLNLGFNWDSPYVGTLFAEVGALGVRFLQFELRDEGNDIPQSFTSFQGGDTINIVLFAITSDTSMVDATLDTRLAFGPVSSTSSSFTTYSPDSIVTYGTGATSETYNGNDYLELGNFSTATDVSCPWSESPAAAWTCDTPLTLTSGNNTTTCELGFWLKVTPFGGAASQTFAADPEGVIGSSGTPN